jgi:hypothetical protein
MAFRGMRSCTVAAVFVVATLTACTPSPTSTSAREREVLAEFVKGYAAGHTQMNVSDRTIALDIEMWELAKCAPGVHFRGLRDLRRGGRTLGEIEVTSLEIRSVDKARQNEVIDRREPSAAIQRGVTDIDRLVRDAFETGMLSLSGVSFDSSGRYALLSYGFRCGGLCGHGGTVVLERKSGRWKPSEFACRDWDS